MQAIPTCYRQNICQLNICKSLVNLWCISCNERNASQTLMHLLQDTTNCSNVGFYTYYILMFSNCFPQRRWCPQQTFSSLRSQIRKLSWPGQARLEMSQVTGLPFCPSMSPALCRDRWRCPSAKIPTWKCHTWSLERCIASTSTPSTTERKVYHLLGNKPQVSAKISPVEIWKQAHVTYMRSSHSISL